MAELFMMPKLGFDMAEGILEEWVKQVGDEINEGDVIAIIETDKASVEVTSFQTGILRQILMEAGSIVPVGAPIAVLGAAGEPIDLAALGLEAAEAVEAPAAAAPESPQAAAPTAPLDASEPAPAPTGRILASPVALRMAAELGLDVNRIPGSGPSGRIIKRDIEAYLKERERTPQKPAPPPIATPAYEPSIEGYSIQPLAPIRRTIARRMAESKQQAPHFYITVSVDMAAAMTLRKQLNAVVPDESRISVNDLILKASAVALRAYPQLNASFAGDEIHVHEQINVGMAVARDTGLMTVVIKNCDTKSLPEIARAARDVVGRAREGRMQADDMLGGTFTVSNLGMFDVDHFIAIINPPQAAILAVGSVQQTPVVVDGELTVGARMKATISADHRVTDGAEAALFMQTFRQALEEPLRLLV